MLGVNLGRLGFLAEVDIDGLPDALARMGDGRYTVEPRMAVRAQMPNHATVTAFSDIALVRVPGHRLAAVAVWVNGQPFIRYAVDAVIVATTTGSTAYNHLADGARVPCRPSRGPTAPLSSRAPIPCYTQSARSSSRSTETSASDSRLVTASQCRLCPNPLGSCRSAHRRSISEHSASCASPAASKRTEPCARTAPMTRDPQAWATSVTRHTMRQCSSPTSARLPAQGF